MLAMLVDTHALWQTAWTSAVAGIGICIVFSMAIVGTSRSSEARRERRVLSGIVHGLLGVLALAVCAGAVVYAVTLITTK